MATHWIRKGISLTATAAVTLVDNDLIYNNNREVSGTITLVQKATVVACYLFGISTTDDTWSVSLIVFDQGISAPTYANPESGDPEIKGQFMFARGPLLYQPRRLISIPVERALYVRTNKELGGNASTFNLHMGFLMQTSL